MANMKHVWIVLLVIGCGSKSPPPANQGSASGNGSAAGSGSAQASDCPERLDCMPPTEGPCPPPGFTERCPNTMITH